MFLVLIFFLASLVNFIQADFDHFASRDDMHWNDEQISIIYKAEVIDGIEFPKSRVFLQNLIQKYPKEFDGVSFYMVRSFSSFAGCGIIGIPYEWLVKLEAEIPVAQQWIEWALLHEAGHIHHQHVKVCGYLNIGNAVFLNIMCIAYSMIFAINFITEKEFKKIYGEHYSKENMNKVLLFSGLGMISCIAGRVVYSRYVAEPQADSFAVEKCQNKEALAAGAKWLDKVSLDNLMYPAVADRVAKINKAIKERFA